MGWIPEDTAVSTPGHAGACTAFAVWGLLCTGTLRQFFAPFCLLNSAMNLNDGIVGIFTEKCYTNVRNRLQASVIVCQQGSEQVPRTLSLSTQKIKGGLQPINTSNSAGFFI